MQHTIYTVLRQKSKVPTGNMQLTDIEYIHTLHSHKVCNDNVPVKLAISTNK